MEITRAERLQKLLKTKCEELTALLVELRASLPDFSVEDSVPVAEQIDLFSEQLTQMVDAVARLRSGEYGRCVQCKEGISLRRLRAVPHARHCLECQQEKEGVTATVELHA